MSTVQLPEARVVEPVLDWAAVENARLLNLARATLLRSGTAVTIDAIAAATSRTPGAVRRWVARQRSDSRLVTVSHDGQVYVPTFQLTATFDDVDPDALAVVRRLATYGMDGWAVWDWFQTANTWLGGDAPVERLAAGDLGVLQRAVSGLLQE